MGRNNRRGHRKPQQGAPVYTPPYSEEILQMSVEGLNLSAPTLEVLQKGGIHTVGDIVKRRKNDMYKIQNFNKKRLFEVVNAITPLKVDFRPDEQQSERPQQDRRDDRAKPQRPEQQGREAQRRDGQQGRDTQQSRTKDGQRPAPKERGQEQRRQSEERPQRGEKQPQNGNKEPQQGKGKKGNNGVDFSRIFPREKLVHSPRIEPQKDRFVKFQRAGKWGFKDENGKEVIPPIYTEALNFREDMAAVEMNGLFGYINRENVLVIPYKYDTAGSFSEGWANVSLGEKCGYIDKEGKETVPFIYDAATAFTGEGYGRVKKDGRWGNIRKNGEVTWQ